MAACVFREAEPQINADERGYKPVTYFGAAHRKVRKDRKAQPRCGTRMTRIARIFTDPSVSAFISVHLRFFKNVIFQTGLTGSTGYVFNHVHSVILSNLKCQGGGWKYE